jgi:hypothetical protein
MERRYVLFGALTDGAMLLRFELRREAPRKRLFYEIDSLVGYLVLNFRFQVIFVKIVRQYWPAGRAEVCAAFDLSFPPAHMSFCTKLIGSL